MKRDESWTLFQLRAKRLELLYTLILIVNGVEILTVKLQIFKGETARGGSLQNRGLKRSLDPEKKV